MQHGKWSFLLLWSTLGLQALSISGTRSRITEASAQAASTVLIEGHGVYMMIYTHDIQVQLLLIDVCLMSSAVDHQSLSLLSLNRLREIAVCCGTSDIYAYTKQQGTGKHSQQAAAALRYCLSIHHLACCGRPQHFTAVHLQP